MSIEQMTQELTDKGIALYSELVRDDFDGREGNTVWSVTITRNGQSYQTEYTQGCAHRHYRSGKPVDFPYGRLTVDALMRNKQSRPNEPVLSDVLWSLVCDAQAVMFGQTFEDFAGDMGYDTDSREAERVYNGCREEYFALVRLFGADGLEELCDFFQDY
jgi:hypothetical protein